MQIEILPESESLSLRVGRNFTAFCGHSRHRMELILLKNYWWVKRLSEGLLQLTEKIKGRSSNPILKCCIKLLFGRIIKANQARTGEWRRENPFCLSSTHSNRKLNRSFPLFRSELMTLLWCGASSNACVHQHLSALNCRENCISFIQWFDEFLFGLDNRSIGCMMTNLNESFVVVNTLKNRFSAQAKGKYFRECAVDRQRRFQLMEKIDSKG